VIKRIVQVSALTLPEWRLLVAALVLLPIVALGLWLGGFKRTRRTLARFTPPVDEQVAMSDRRAQEARQVARMVKIAASHGLYRADCLKQALVLWWLLARRGIPAEIVFGLNTASTDRFSAHAWVECQAGNLSDDETHQQQLVRFGKSGAQGV
jgi:hypothetical protein